jgi:UDP-glucuronate 4-epimerase
LYNLLKSKKFSGNEILNICSNKPLNIIKLVKNIERKSKKIKIYKRKMQKADVIKTHGDNTKIKKFKLIKKFTSFDVGVKNTLDWYKKYNNF